MVHHPGQAAGQRDRHTRSLIFLEGDPDQPIVTGRTFHATNRVPYDLPAHKTRTVLRTETHQGEGFNELRFEDQAGAEEIYIHGQKDLNVLIENNAAWHIGHDLHTDIDNERVTRVRIVPGKDGAPPSLGHDHLTVEGEKRDHIKADYSLTVDGSQHQKLGESLLVEVGQEIHIKVGEKVVLEADAEMTVKAGGRAPAGLVSCRAYRAGWLTRAPRMWLSLSLQFPQSRQLLLRSLSLRPMLSTFFPNKEPR